LQASYQEEPFFAIL